MAAVWIVIPFYNIKSFPTELLWSLLQAFCVVTPSLDIRPWDITYHFDVKCEKSSSFLIVGWSAHQKQVFSIQRW